MNNAPLLAFETKCDSDELWMLSCEYNVVTCFSRATMKLIDYFIIPRNSDDRNSYLMMAMTKEKIYILPYLDNKIYFIDRNTRTINELDIDIGTISSNGMKIVFGQAINNKIIMLSSATKGILVYDEINKSVSIHNEFAKEIGIYLCKEEFDFNEYVVCDGSVLLALVNNSTLVLEYMLDEGKYQVHDFQKFAPQLSTIRTMDKYGNSDRLRCFLTTASGFDCVWEPSTGKVDLVYEDGYNDSIQYIHVYEYNNKKYYVGKNREEIRIIENNHTMVKSIEFDKYPTTSNVVKFGMVYKSNRGIFLQRRKDDYIYFLNFQNDEISKTEFKISRDKKESILNEVYSEGFKGLGMETNTFGLGTFLNALLSK